MIAEAWGIELEFDVKKKAAEQIATLISQDHIMSEIFPSISEKSQKALKVLVRAKGEIHWDQFTRKFGELREMGAARREREHPDRTPISVTEALFYKALLGRAFFETSQGLREFAFIPDEFYQFIKPADSPVIQNTIKSLPANIVEKKLLSNDHIIDSATTILAGLRTGLSIEEMTVFTPIVPYSFLIRLLYETKLITNDLDVNSEKVKQFLEADRGPALRQLARAWKASHEINELDLIETLVFESQGKIDPNYPRAFLIGFIHSLSTDSWYGIQEFCDWVFQNQPDILRSGGDYDAWFIKNKATGEYIKGFDNWQQVEGEYIRMLIQKPMFWLGFIDLGKSPGDLQPTVFRKSKWFDALMSGQELRYPSLQKKDFEIEKSGRIIIDRYFARDIRYQMARCCAWETARGQNFFYRFSPHTFNRMEQQGLKVNQLITLINRFARKPVPQNIMQALERWEKHGKEVDIKKVVVLKVKSAAIMDRLLDSNAKKYVLSRLDPTTAEITAGSAPFIKAALIEMGIFAEIMPDV